MKSEWLDWDFMKPQKMDSKDKHPFAITCRKCGSNDISVMAWDNHYLEIKCESCGFSLNCGVYRTMSNDYSDC